MDDSSSPDVAVSLLEQLRSLLILRCTDGWTLNIDSAGDNYTLSRGPRSFKLAGPPDPDCLIMVFPPTRSSYDDEPRWAFYCHGRAAPWGYHDRAVHTSFDDFFTGTPYGAATAFLDVFRQWHDDVRRQLRAAGVPADAIDRTRDEHRAHVQYLQQPRYIRDKQSQVDTDKTSQLGLF